MERQKEGTWYINVWMRGRVIRRRGGTRSQRELEGCSMDWISSQAITVRIKVERTETREEAQSQVREVVK